MTEIIDMLFHLFGGDELLPNIDIIDQTVYITCWVVIISKVYPFFKEIHKAIKGGFGLW